MLGEVDAEWQRLALTFTGDYEKQRHAFCCTAYTMSTGEKTPDLDLREKNHNSLGLGAVHKLCYA